MRIWYLFLKMFRLNKFWQQPLPNSDEEDEKKTTNNFYLNGGMILVELIENEPCTKFYYIYV